MKKEAKVPVFNQYQTVSPATKLLQKRRKMYEIHEAYQAQKQLVRQQQIVFKQQQSKINQKDKDFQQRMTAFCQFSHENEIKKKRAEEKAKFEEKAYLEKEEQIRNLERQIEELTKNQKRYLNKVGHFRKYQEYLEKVRTTYNDQYPEMSDILNRYQTLKKSHDDMIQKRQTMEQKYDILKKQALNEEKELNQAILTLNNETKQFSRRIQEKMKEKNEIQSQVQRSNEEFSNKNLNLGKIFMAIDNLHSRCNENTLKLKYEFDDKGVITEKKQIKAKKIQGEASNTKNDGQINYEQKSRQASTYLKNIVSHMKDLKAIIDLYKHYKQEKGEKL